jgi:hypothetical protein
MFPSLRSLLHKNIEILQRTIGAYPIAILQGHAFASPPWCTVVKTMKRHVTMNRKKVQRTGAKAQAPPWVRASISFPSDLYETLDAIAQQKKVSLAWVVRDAAERYVEGRSRMDEGQTPRT